MTTTAAAETLTATATVKIRWEHSGLEDTCNVLMQINRNGHRNVESMANYIRTIAYNYACKCQCYSERPSLTGTGGWYVTFIESESEDYDYNVEVTLMPYVVAKHLGLR